MAKYDFNFKLKVVKSYLNKEGGYVSIAKQHGVANHSQVERWVNTYNTLGENGLKRKNKNTFYTIQFKLDVINYMITTKSSAQEVANHFGMNNSTLIAIWKQKFLHGGVDALSKMKGRPSMNKNKNTKEKNKLTREQELEYENKLLKAELAFLKKLRASGMNVPERLKNNTKQK
ncbi:transposase family protein [Clostridioides difficile CD160]|nr:transposase family protein [Clostridioides difficile CD160]